MGVVQFSETCKLKKRKKTVWELFFCYKAHGGSTKQCGGDDFDLVLEQVQNVTSYREKKKVGQLNYILQKLQSIITHNGL